jgi:tRNA-dihydrouridine synthase B
MTALHPDERPLVQQVFGADARVMAEAVRIIDETHGPDAFDINMGCPVRKLTSNFNGAALIKDPAGAAKIVRAVKAATDKPVSVKTRLGWSDPTEILDFIRVLEQAGADLVSIHGRTKKQGYSGRADWEMIGRARERVSIPVLCNGDIFSAEDAVRALEVSGCAGILVARGALGNPWVFRQIRQALKGEKISQTIWTERIKIIKRHAALHAELYGGDRPLISFRKHLAWYFKGFPGARKYRQALMSISTVEELNDTLGEIPREGPENTAGQPPVML